ncbi:polymorphic toxin-type HINT domain-containing protein [Paenibacillus abyssi]|nr:polymorphic toxin-type HINT domain-containing protein [Paenibacillus abyssi]
MKNKDGTYLQKTPSQWSYIYRRDGKLYQIIDPNGNTVQLTYLGSLLTEVSTLGGKLTFTYGDGGKVARVTDHTGRYAAYEYDAINHVLTAMILPDGARIDYGYDDRQRMTSIRNPNETATLINEYDDQDRVVSQVDFAGVWGEIKYYPEEMQTVTTDALGRKTVYQYDERYRKTAMTYPDGTTERFEYDKHDNMTAMTDRNKNVWEYMYDERGNLIRSKDPAGYQTKIRYNALNLPEEIIDPLENKTILKYDSRGNLVSITDALGAVSRFTVNGQGIPESMTNAKGETTTIQNNEYGMSGTIADPLGNRQELTRDPLHRITGILDALGQQTKLEYDPRGRLTARIDALGNTERYEYDRNSNLTGYTDPAGARTVFEYDGLDKLLSEKDAMGNITRYSYDAFGNMIKVTEANGAVTSYTYNISNRVASVTDPEGKVSEYEYDGNGNLIRTVDPNGGETRIEYDGRNLPVKVTDANGGTSLFSYDAAGRLTQETDPLGHSVGYVYDELGRVVTQTDALGQKTTYTYDDAGRLVHTTEPNGAQWKLEYDARGMLVKVTDPLGQVSAMTRDALGQVVNTTDEAGKKSTFQYNPLGQVTRVINPLGYATDTVYDARGLLTAVKDAKGQTTSYSYDPLGRLLQVTNALGNTTSYGYDVLGNLTSKTDALGRVTNYQYNLRSELIKEIGPEQRVTELSYDALGNRVGVTHPDGQTTSYGYDVLSRLTDIQYSDGKRVGYEYDATSRRTKMTDELGTTTYTFDALNRLIQVTDPYSRTIRYEWTASGQRSRIEYPDASSVSYQYDLLERMTAVTDAQGNTTTYAYDPRGLLVSKQIPSMGLSSYQYDDAGQLLELTHQNQFGNVLERLAYAYDPVGNRIQSERLSNEDDDDDDNDYDDDDRLRIVTDYVYDALNQLVEVQTQNMMSSKHPVSTTKYAYDAVGNRLEKTSAWGKWTKTESYTYDAADRLIKMASEREINDYLYDPRGNLLSVTQQRLLPPRKLKIDSDILGKTLTDSVYNKTVTDSVYRNLDSMTEEDFDPLRNLFETAKWSKPRIVAQYVWNGANRLSRQVNYRGDITRYAYDGDDNRMKMTVDYNDDWDDDDRVDDWRDDDDDWEDEDWGDDDWRQYEQWLREGLQSSEGGNVPFERDNADSDIQRHYGNEDRDDDWYEEEDWYEDGHNDWYDDWFEDWNDEWDDEDRTELYFTNDVSLALPEPLQITGGGDGKWKQTYVYGAGGERLSMTSPSKYRYDNDDDRDDDDWDDDGQPRTQWYLQDALGSAIGMLDKRGRVTARAHYDEFGVMLGTHTFDSDDRQGPGSLFGYTGLGYDYTSGLNYARARYYQPELGRFISEDTYKGELNNPLTLNLYTYVHNNPLRYTDPSGHCITDWLGKSFCEKAWKTIKNDVITTWDSLRTIHSDWYTAVDYWSRGGLTQFKSYLEISKNKPLSLEQFVAAFLIFIDYTPQKMTREVSTEILNGTHRFASKCNCFTAGTKVITDEGEKPIEEIEVGDKVLAKDDETGEMAYKEVEWLFQRDVEETYNITVGGEVITTTDEHPFWIVGKGWVEAQHLAVGDVLTTSDGKELAIEKIEVKQEQKTVYNFKVKDFHTYFVSNLGIWTHNACGPYQWGNKNTLQDHYDRHGSYFGAKNPTEYANKANDFFKNRNKYKVKVDTDGTIRVYDPKTNSFGSYNADGTTKTFYKPKRGQAYWDDQPGK